jgi:general stress protein 26
MTFPTDRAWEVIEKVGICMLTTRASDGEFHSRPVEARLCRDEGCVYVLTELRSAKEHELKRDLHLGLTFVDKKTNAYLAITGHGGIAARSARNHAMMSSTHYRHTND